MIISRKLFSDKDIKVNLSSVSSNRGLGRAILTAPFTVGGSLAGGYVSKSAADKADKEGLSDDEILQVAKKKGRKVGALTGAGVGLLASTKNAVMLRNMTGDKGKVISSLVVPIAVGTGVSAGLGTVGGHFASSVNTKSRLAKRAKLERDLNRKINK